MALGVIGTPRTWNLALHRLKKITTSGFNAANTRGSSGLDPTSSPVYREKEILDSELGE